MTAEIHLIRHAQSEANAGGATSDPSAIPLSDCGYRQAIEFSHTVTQRPDLIITSTFTRAIATATPTIARYPGVFVRTENIGEFTYLSPLRCANTTVAQRRAWVDAYWQRSDPTYVDGDGAESFADLIDRVRIEVCKLKMERGLILVFGHGQVMQAMRWFIENPTLSITPPLMTAFRAYDVSHPIQNLESFLLDA
jgi:broad specificity phosphatase PhoE